MKSIRLFFAWQILSPPGRQLHLISNAISDLSAGQDGLFRSVHPRNYHVTTVFLGEQPDEALPLLKDGLASLNKLPDEEIRLPIRGIEGMPNRNKPNSFHISLEDPGKRLAHQKKMLEDYLVHIAAQSAVNWKPEDRSFTPHLTLGYRRKKADPAELGELLTLFGLSWQALVPELRKGLLISPKPRLFQSTMLPEGPQYQLLA